MMNSSMQPLSFHKWTKIQTLLRSALLPIFIFSTIEETKSAEIESIKVWQTHEIILEAENEYSNPYLDMEVWAHLEGPGFNKKVHGFWDGSNSWKIRLVATESGDWTWTSHSNPRDSGLNGQQGKFRAERWPESDLRENPNRRGFIRPTSNGHALQYADESPYFIMADTIWAASTRVLRFDSDACQAGISFKDAIHTRKEQGYNAVAFISAFPNWAEEGLGDKIVVEGTIIRSHGEGWRTNDGMDELGNRPFEMLPEPRVSGRPVVADFWRINPAYFQQLDHKMTHLFDEGFVSYLETFRRDHGQSLKRWTPKWDFAFARYFQYLIARYGSYNVIFSALHYDWSRDTIRLDDWKSSIDLHYRIYGLPPYGQLVTTLTSNASHLEWGHELPWLQLHGVGNEGPRNNRYGQWIYDQFHLANPKPTLNQEPIYPGRDNGNRDNSLSHAWTSVLCGALAGHIYGSQYFSGVNAREALDYASAPVLPHLKTFILSEGSCYQRLIPRTHPNPDFHGQVIIAATKGMDMLMAFYQRGSSGIRIEELNPETLYTATWFNPESGEFSSAGVTITDNRGNCDFPGFPRNKQTADQHWALKLMHEKP